MTRIGKIQTAEFDFSRGVQNDYNLSSKHLFKKKAGNAKWYYRLAFDGSLEQDLAALGGLCRAGTPFMVFGAHTNLYITDRGYDGLFVDMDCGSASLVFDESEETFTISSNASVSALIKFAMEKGYDFAALAGVPGLAGSAAAGNSGWTPSGKAFGDFVKEMAVYDFEKGETVHFRPDKDFFTERGSFIKRQNQGKTRYFIKQLVLKADFIGQEAVREKFDAQMAKREKSLRFGFAEGCAGSLWSNAHLRKSIGKSFPNMLRENPSINADFNGATYSPNGSHFFITGSATTDRDVARLFIHTLEKVREIYGVGLHKEVAILDADGEIDLETFIKRNI